MVAKPEIVVEIEVRNVHGPKSRSYTKSEAAARKSMKSHAENVRGATCQNAITVVWW